MSERFLSWLASLRVRLIATYLLVTAISLGFLFLLLLKPVEKFLLKREEDQLAAVATVLASTIPSPVEATPEVVEVNLKWTQRRCRLYLRPRLPETRIRVLDATGAVLTDSDFAGDWDTWKAMRGRRTPLARRPEILSALRGAYDAAMRAEPERAHGPYTMYIAMPVLRTDPQTDARRLGYIMYLDRPVESVRKNLRDLRRLIEVHMVASLLLTTLVSIVLSSNLSAGLRAATRVAREFAAGRMAQRMRARGRDEVGQLGAAFNQMADALQRQEQLRRNLLADVSHELRTPLTAISGCADTLGDGMLRDDPEAAERFLGIILRESARLQRLVSDILELSRLQSGVVEMPRRALPLLPLVGDAVEIAALHARQEGVTVEWQPPAPVAGPLLVYGNEDRLAQALRNLLDNARHHTPAGKRVTVSVQPHEDRVVVQVCDEGEGIPPEDLPWVFDRFYRAGRGGATGGTGLGLAIVREIMQAHEGRVTVESTVGQGTTFSLHLRVAQADVDG